MVPPIHPKLIQRHIIVNDFDRTIYVQVMRNGTGDLLQHEYDQIQAGNYLHLIEASLKANIADAANNGYAVRPVALKQAESNVSYLMQMTGISERKAHSGLWVPDYFKNM
jgi:hypothetical protein